MCRHLKDEKTGIELLGGGGEGIDCMDALVDLFHVESVNQACISLFVIKIIHLIYFIHIKLQR